MKIRLLFIVLISINLTAQIGGERVYTFLNSPTSARQAALGGATLTMFDEVSQSLWNPAVISNKISSKVALNYVNYLSDINYFSGDYAQTFNERLGTVYTNVTYLNYGKFIAADEIGAETGTFKAYDMAWTVGYAYQIPCTKFHIGLNTKFIHSAIESYKSMGVATDLGVSYYAKELPYSLALVVRNIGAQIQSYDEAKEQLPLRIAMGFSYRPEHVPLRFHATLDNLQRWKMSYVNPSDNTTDLDGTVAQKEPSASNNFMRHLVVGAELFPEKAFSLRVGYNFQRGQELKLKDTRTFAGLTGGFGVSIKRFDVNYAFTKYHPVSNSHTFSLIVNLNP